MVLLEKPLLIGIAGGSASGKTTIAKMIYDEFRDTHSVTVIREDDYYKDQSDKTYEERCLTNYDHPLAFDTDLLHEHLRELMAGRSIEKPTYDYKVHNRSNVTERIYPCEVIVLEGLFVLENEITRNMMNMKIFCDSPADVRFIRRLLRDVNERNRTIDSVVMQYMSTVRAMHDEFVEPSKRHADLIIPDVGTNAVAFDLLKTKIRSIIG